MDLNGDELLLSNIARLLSSEKDASLISTCEFLETVVIHDLPTEIFLRQRDILKFLLKLCQHGNLDEAYAACSCLDSICHKVISRAKQQNNPHLITVMKLLSGSGSSRDSTGDCVEEDTLLQSDMALTITKACHQIILTTSKPFDITMKLMSAVVNLALVTQSQPTSLENIEFYQVLAAISVALRAASRQHFVTFLCLVLGAIENYQVQTSSLGNDIIYEVYNALLDASFSHFHPEFVPICLAVLGENLTLQDKYQRTCLLLDAFRNLAKFLKNSPQNKTKDEDLLFVVALLKLDDGLAESLLPSIFQHLKEHGGKPAVAMTLLLLSQEEPIPEKVYQHLTELASPIKSLTIGPHIGELLVDNDVIRAIKDGMLSGNDQVKPEAEKLLTLVLKGRTWMSEQQWQTLMSDIVPTLLLDIGKDLHRFKMLGPVLWDLIQQSVILSPDEKSFPQLDSSFTIRFLIRYLSVDSPQRSKASLCLISALIQQPQAHLLLPRISAVDPSDLVDSFQGDWTLQLKSTAKFEASTLTDTMQCLLRADVINARTYLIKLAIILEDTSLHPTFLECDGVALLAEYLANSLMIGVGDADTSYSIMSSIVKCILYISHSDPVTRKRLARDCNLLLNLLRATMLTKDDVIARRHCLALLQLLAANEPSTVSAGPLFSDATGVVSTWSDLWSKAVIRWSAKFAFNTELSKPPLAHAIPAWLQMSNSECELSMATNDYGLVERALVCMASAREHQDVEHSLTLLREVFQRTYLPVQIFNLPWATAFETFFSVLPESSKDEEIFTSILKTLMLSFKQLERIPEENIIELSLFQWLYSLLTDERHVFWTLVIDQCHQYRHSTGELHLWPTLLRFISSAVCVLKRKTSAPVGGSLAHILRLMCSTFDEENSSQTYQLNSVKLILDCCIHTCAVISMPNGFRGTIDPSIIASLLRHTTTAVAYFSHGSRKHGNKGRSVIQSCAQLIDLLVSLQATGTVPLPDLDWLMFLLRHSDPIVKTAALHISINIFRDVHLTDDIAEIALSVLFCAEECCTTVEQAALLLSQHPRRMTDQAIRQVCAMASSVRIRANQPLLVALLNLLINSCIRIQAAPNGLAAVANEVVPVVSSILISSETRADVKAAIFCLLYRIALLRPKVIPWLIQQVDCTSKAIESLLDPAQGKGRRSEWASLVGESALYLSFLLQSEASEKDSSRGKNGKVFKAVLFSVSEQWDRFLSYLTNRKLTDLVARHLLLFLQTFLVLALNNETTIDCLQLDSTRIETFCRWLLPNLPVRTDDSLRQSGLQVLGILLLCCSTNLTVDTIRITTEFITKELQLTVLHDGGNRDVKPISCLIHLAQNLILNHPEAEKELLNRGVLTPLLELWKRNKKCTGGSASVQLLRDMIAFEKLLVGRDTVKEVHILLKSMIDHLEEKEAVLSRQSTPINEEDWDLVESLHQLFLASVPSLECRRLLAKYKCWSHLAEMWHPVYLKRIINRQHHFVLASLNAQRSRLLVSLTMHAEPILPELLESAAVQTLVDLAAQTPIDRQALLILRNMAFHSGYKNVLLTTSSVLPFFVRLLTSSSDEEVSMLAVSALISLASNNQRVKSEVRSMTDAWFQRNPPVVSGCKNVKFGYALSELCLMLQKLVDV